MSYEHMNTRGVDRVQCNMDNIEVQTQILCSVKHSVFLEFVDQCVARRCVICADSQQVLFSSARRLVFLEFVDQCADTAVTHTDYSCGVVCTDISAFLKFFFKFI